MNDAMKRRLLAFVALAVALGTLFGISLIGDLEYFLSPSEVEALQADLEDKDADFAPLIRLGGLVEPGSLDWPDDATEGTFRVTDGDTTTLVHATGLPPQMFREGIGVVLEGRMNDKGVFESSEIMVKHNNEYRAPDDDGTHDPKKFYETLLEGGDS